MDPARADFIYRIEHRHNDGSWSEMREDERPHHDPAQHDDERLWGLRRVFRCTSCSEKVILVPEEGGPPEEA
jgi:hypothetical protein